MLFNVPGAKSSFGFPGTVTRPGLLGCLNCGDCLALPQETTHRPEASEALH
jgi:hypothetical protein